MRDLAIPVLEGSITLLAIYAAGLIFVAQHIAERYTPALYPSAVWKIGGVWLALLALIALCALAVALLPLSQQTNIADVALLALAIVLIVLGLFRTFKAAANRQHILDMATNLRGEDRLPALRDLIWNTANRGDVAATERLLGFPTHGSLEQAQLLHWLTEYPQLLQHAWLVQQVLARLTADVLDANAAERLRPAFVGLLVHNLDQGAFGAARDIVLGAMRAVSEAPTFTEAHESLVFDVGFRTHFVGDEGHASPRRSHPIVSLGEVQGYFLAELTPLRRSILAHGDRLSVTWFALLLQRLSEASIGPIFIARNVYGLLEDGYAAGILEMQAVEALACAIRGTRRDVDGEPPDEWQTDHADALAAHLALYVVALGGQDQLGRIMGNAGFHPASKLPRRLAMNNGLGEETYKIVAHLLGCKGWAPC